MSGVRHQDEPHPRQGLTTKLAGPTTQDTRRRRAGHQPGAFGVPGHCGQLGTHPPPCHPDRMAAGTTAPPARDPAAIYGLAGGILVIDRGADGRADRHRPAAFVLLAAPPPGAARVLSALDGTAVLDDVLRVHRADPRVWLEVIGNLVDVGLIGRLSTRRPAVRFAAERASLAHRFGPASADRVLAARQDSVVVVRGSTRMAIEIAALLAGSGIGHIHHRPHRAVQPTDLPRSAGRPPAGWSAGGSRASRCRRRSAGPTAPTTRSDGQDGTAGRADPCRPACAGRRRTGRSAPMPRRCRPAGWRTCRSGPGRPARWSGRWCCRAARPACTAPICIGRTPTPRCRLSPARAGRSASSPALHLLAAVTGGAVAQALRNAGRSGPTGDRRRHPGVGSGPAASGAADGIQHPECGCGAVPAGRDAGPADTIRPRE